MKNFIFCVVQLKENVMKFDEMIKERLKYNRMQTKYDSTVKITISEFASFLIPYNVYTMYPVSNIYSVTYI